jgi:EAL and modified HD-GYP domain-containing signal transduction protein
MAWRADPVLVTGGSSASLDVVVGRQPIFTADLDVYGYELLFRSVSDEPIGDPEHATAQVLVNTFTEFGLSALVGDKVPFVNVTSPFLSGELPLPFEPGDAVLEILETVEVDDELVAHVAKLHAEGHRFALDDYVDSPERRRLLAYADIVKVDILASSPEQITEIVTAARAAGSLLLAEKVESDEQLSACRAMGFDYYQGYLLAKPVVFKQQALGPGQVALLQLLLLLADPESSVDQIEAFVRMDPALSYRVLRVVNSAGVGLARQLSSIREAVVVLGRNTLRQWLLVMVLADGSPLSHELLLRALVRSRMCELLSDEAGCPADVAFTAALLSALDLLLGSPLESVLASLPLDETVRAAILDSEGSLGRLLKTVVAYEEGDARDPRRLPIPVEQVRHAWADAVKWAVQATEKVSTAAQSAGVG